MNLVLSIITINLNNQTGLQKTIESVINQTFKNLEFIVIDGGSTDGSIEVIKLYQDKITYWISEHDEGIYNAMNKGIKIAKGRYCLFLNSGDFFISHDVIKLADPFSFTVPIVYGDGKVQQKKLITQNNLPDTLSLDYFFNISLFHPSTFIKRELFEIYGLYNENNKIVSDW
jgi:glycosyltransferase involved in cell wall biosynthesis